MALSANLEPPGLWCLLWRLAKDDVIQDIADESCYSFGWRLLQTWQSQPAKRREFCGAERLAQLVWGRWARFLLLDDEALPWHGTLRALDGCSASGRLPQLPLCLGWAHFSLATTGSLQCVMGEGPSLNWVQMVLDHPLMYPRLDERQLLLWRKYVWRCLCAVPSTACWWLDFKVGLLTGFAGHVWSDRSAAGQQRRLNYFTSVRSRLTSDTNNNKMTSYPYRIWCQANQTLMQQITLLQAAGALSASHGRVVRPTKGLKHKQNSHCVTNYGGTFWQTN